MTYMTKRFGSCLILSILGVWLAIGPGWCSGTCAPIPGDRPPFVDCPPPLTVDGALMIPMRAMFQFLACTVQFWPQNGAIQATAYDGKTVTVWIGNTRASVDGRVVTMQAPPKVIGESAYVPLRFIATSMGASVNWSEAHRTATVCYCRRKGTMTVGQRGIAAIYCG